MANVGYYCSDKRVVLKEATDIIVTTNDGEERLWGDRWEHLDGQTLVVYRDDRVMHVYAPGTWPGGCYSFGQRVEVVPS